MSFTRRTEDFVCVYCGTLIKGNGYTNHCSRCLWSTHVDVDPGDRAEMCGGLMEPIALEGSTSHEKIRFRCLSCGVERVNKVSPHDEREALLALSVHHGTIGL
jgi:hypothetical protein